MTSFKHPIYPNVQFDTAEDSMFLVVDGENVAMFDGEEVERLSAVALSSLQPKNDLQEFFEGVLNDVAEYVPQAAASLFIECEAEINNTTMK